MKEMHDKQRLFEIIMVILTGLGKLVFVDYLNLKFIYVIAAILFWTGYFVNRVSRNRDLIKYWGLSFSNIKETSKIVGGVGIMVLCSFIVYGIDRHTIKLSWNILFVLITYPIWGLVQQFLMMSLFAGNLKDLGIKQINKVLIIILTATLFSIVHYPSFQLILATFIMAIFYSIIFLNKRNIIPLGIFHGVLGGIFYYVVLNRDPWLEFIAIINK
jgi:uncharacterized protein